MKDVIVIGVIGDDAESFAKAMAISLAVKEMNIALGSNEFTERDLSKSLDTLIISDTEIQKNFEESLIQMAQLENPFYIEPEPKPKFKPYKPKLSSKNKFAHKNIRNNLKAHNRR